MKTWIVAAAGLIILVPACRGEAADDRLAGYWKLDEGRGTLAKDSSGNGNDGVLKCDWASGTFGNAVYLEGNAVEIGDKASLYVGESNFTIECWVMPQKLVFNERETTVRILSASAWPVSYVVVDLEDGGHLELETGAEGKDGKAVEARVRAKTALSAEKWSHIALVCDRKGHVGRIYINGVKDAESALPAGFTGAISGYPLSIGSTWHGFLGLISEVKIHRTALSDSEVKASCAKEASKRTDARFTKRIPKKRTVTYD